MGHSSILLVWGVNSFLWVTEKAQRGQACYDSDCSGDALACSSFSTLGMPGDYNDGKIINAKARVVKVQSRMHCTVYNM